MTADPNSIDLPALLEARLQRAEPDLLRSMLSTFVQALMSAEADAVCGADYGSRSVERGNRRNGYWGSGVGHPRRHRRAGDPEAAGGLLLPRLAAGAAQTGGAGAHLGGGHLLPAR